MNTQSVNTSLYQKGDISLERIYGKYRNSFIRYAGKVLSDEFYAEDVVQLSLIHIYKGAPMKKKIKQLIERVIFLCQSASCFRILLSASVV